MHRFAPFVALLALACSAPEPSSSCDDSSDCATGQTCFERRCVARPDAATPDDAFVPVDAACVCEPGESCARGACEADCGDPSAVPCGAGDECDYATGACVASGTALLGGDGQRCGASGPQCRPGTECTLAGTCEPAPPCASMRCSTDGSTCWGTACTTTRPVADCSPAPLERIQMADFLRGVDNGLTDLELDDACNVYGVTVISGTDYLRQLSPDGTLTQTAGVTNLNMGEVAVLRPYSSEFGSEPGEVALTYTCCVTCGCVSVDPQGVARFDRDAMSLPMVIVATPTSGTGPFGASVIDSGPYGLTWGRDRTLYVGNVTHDGDLVRADLETGTTTTIAELGARVYATTTFDPLSLLVALADGRVLRVGTDGAGMGTFATLPLPVTSMVRDPFLGVVYVSLADGSVTVHSVDGAMVSTLAPAGAPGRIAYSPDGALYYLRTGFGGAITVERIELPSTLD